MDSHTKIIHFGERGARKMRMYDANFEIITIIIKIKIQSFCVQRISNVNLHVTLLFIIYC